MRIWDMKDKDQNRKVNVLEEAEITQGKEKKRLINLISVVFSEIKEMLCL